MEIEEIVTLVVAGVGILFAILSYILSHLEEDHERVIISHNTRIMPTRSGHTSQTLSYTRFGDDSEAVRRSLDNLERLREERRMEYALHSRAEVFEAIDQILEEKPKKKWTYTPTPRFFIGQSVYLKPSEVMKLTGYKMEFKAIIQDIEFDGNDLRYILKKGSVTLLHVPYLERYIKDCKWS